MITSRWRVGFTPAELLSPSRPMAFVTELPDDWEDWQRGGPRWCRGCRLPTTVAPVWPCRLWEIGKEMERLRAAAGRR
jgi:hypothetical protein